MMIFNKKRKQTGLSDDWPEHIRWIFQRITKRNLEDEILLTGGDCDNCENSGKLWLIQIRGNRMRYVYCDMVVIMCDDTNVVKWYTRYDVSICIVRNMNMTVTLGATNMTRQSHEWTDDSGNEY